MELMKRLQALEDESASNKHSRAMDDFMGAYGSKFKDDRDLGEKLFAQLESDGVDISDEAVERILTQLREEIADLSDKIADVSMQISEQGAEAGGQPPGGDMMDTPYPDLPPLPDAGTEAPPPDAGVPPSEGAPPPPDAAGALPPPPDAGTEAPPPPDASAAPPLPPEGVPSDERLKDLSPGEEAIIAGAEAANTDASMLGTAGAAIGTAVGGPVGGVIGKAAGELVDKGGKSIANAGSSEDEVPSDERVKSFATEHGLLDEETDLEELYNYLKDLEELEDMGHLSSGDKALLRAWRRSGEPDPEMAQRRGEIQLDPSHFDVTKYSPEDVAELDTLSDMIAAGDMEGLNGLTEEDLPFLQEWNKYKLQRAATGVADAKTDVPDDGPDGKPMPSDDDIDENEIIAAALARKY
jgi:hypothetical protein